MSNFQFVLTLCVLAGLNTVAWIFAQERKRMWEDIRPKDFRYTRIGIIAGVVGLVVVLSLIYSWIAGSKLDSMPTPVSMWSKSMVLQLGIDAVIFCALILERVSVNRRLTAIEKHFAPTK